MDKAQVASAIEDAKVLQAKIAELETKTKALEEEKAKALANASSFVVGNRSDSDEARALAAFGANDVKKLLTINTAAERFEKVDPRLKQTVVRLKESVDIARMTAQMFYGDGLDRVSSDGEIIAGRVKSLLDTRYGREELAPRLKAFSSSALDSFIPQIVSSQYIEEFELDYDLQRRFKQVTMPSPVYDLPVIKDVLKAQLSSENAAAQAREFSGTTLTFRAKKFESHHVLPEEITEDLAPDLLQIARFELAQSHTRAIESCIINGDLDGTHIDADTQAASAVVCEKAWNGLRRQALANAAAGGTHNVAGALSETALFAIKTKLKKFGVNPQDLIWIVGPAVYNQLLALPSMLTLDKAGPRATMAVGQAGSIMGIPVVVSGMMREDLNASGVYDGTTTSKGGILLVNAKRWYVGMRRAPSLRIVQDLPNYDRYLMAAYQRLDFQGHAQSAAEVSVCYGYNVAL
jgi:HK97 family phage major capsid protein